MDNLFVERLKERVLESLKGEDLKIILFGSRARRDNIACSDVDIGIIPKGEFDKGEFDRRKLILLREGIEDLNIPYKVDIVDFSSVSEVFRREALKGAEIWKD
jgi:predicted nucleotidyltransferase